MRLESGVYHKGPTAAPVFLVNPCPDSMHIGGWIGSRERDPEKMIQRRSSTLAVVHHDNQRP